MLGKFQLPTPVSSYAVYFNARKVPASNTGIQLCCILMLGKFQLPTPVSSYAVYFNARKMKLKIKCVTKHYSWKKLIEENCKGES
jgi:hypothetical protein